MNRLYTVLAALMSLCLAQAQDPLKELQANIPSEYDYYRLTDDRIKAIPQIDNTSHAVLKGHFLSEELFATYKKEGNSYRTYFEGIFAAINANQGDIITMSFEFNADSMSGVKPTKLKPYPRRALVVDTDNIFIVGETSFYWGTIGYDSIEVRYDSDYNTMAIRQRFDGVYYPVARRSYIWRSDIDMDVSNSEYKIVVNRYGKIAEISFEVDDKAAFDLSDETGMLKYNLLRYVRVTATDVYGRDIPILNSLASQWQVDKETGIARFTPILYPFSCTIDGLDDSYETDATNKSASTEEDDNVPNAGTTLDNCMTLEAVNPNMLLLDLNKGGTVTDIATINANATAQDVWYDMFGRKYITKPTAAGLYIHNGKKEVVK